MPRKPDYGIDSPAIIAVEIGLSGAAPLAAWLCPHFLGLPLRPVGMIAGVYLLVSAGGMLFYSKAGKLRLRERLLNLIPWRGDEMVLDVGCGRGLLLVAAARRLTTGKATGVDIWV